MNNVFFSERNESEASSSQKEEKNYEDEEDKASPSYSPPATKSTETGDYWYLIKE